MYDEEQGREERASSADVEIARELAQEPEAKFLEVLGSNRVLQIFVLRLRHARQKTAAACMHARIVALQLSLQSTEVTLGRVLTRTFG